MICTAALELSTNQVTYFFSQQKNTEEMCKLIDVLLQKYSNEDKIYISWDAATWHSSRRLTAKVKEVNELATTKSGATPMVILAPLPASAQFLNVIEAVFGGLCKAVIHNSDYQSADECKAAISRYFNERNTHFLKYPQKAGKTIWGKEKVASVFDDGKNFKHTK